MSGNLHLAVLLACVFSSIEALSPGSQASTNQIPGDYENKQLGFRLRFPVGWEVTVSTPPNGTTIMLTLNKHSGFPELAASDFSTITLSAGANLSLLDDRMKNNSLYDNCNTSENSKVDISGKEFDSSIVQCPTIRYKVYYFSSPGLTVNYSYTALPSSFEADLEDFERSANTLSID